MNKKIKEVIKRIDKNRQNFLINNLIEELKKLPDEKFYQITNAIDIEYNRQLIQRTKK